MASLECIQWIRDELEAHGDLQDLSPPLADTKSLCEFVTDGRALCLLTNAVLESEAEELPKNLQLSKFHALERVQFFIKWCRTRAKLEEHQVFTTVQLLDEVNETAVSETIVALRNKTRPGLKTANSMSQYYFDGDSNARASTSSTTSSGSNSANNANRLSSFLNKFPSAPVVVSKSSQNKPPMNHRVSLTSSVSSNQSPRDVEEPVPTDEENSKSRLRIPSIFKSNNKNNINTSATPRSSVISNASSTASTSKDEGQSRSWSSKLSAFSRSVSSSSNVSAPQSTPKTPSAAELDNNTPQNSPPASPYNRVSIPSAFSAPAPAAPKSMSKLSAFLSSVETTPVAPASCAPSRDTKDPDPVGEVTPEENLEPAVEDNQAEHEHATIEEENPAEVESAKPDVETEHEPLKKPASSAKLLAFLQAVEPAGATPPKVEVETSEEEDEDFVAVNGEGAISADEETLAIEEVASVKKAPVEDEAVVGGKKEKEETVETPEVQEVLIKGGAKTKTSEVHDEVLEEAHVEIAKEETSEEEVEDTPEDETPDVPEVAPVVPIVESSALLEENVRLLAENRTLTEKLETTENAITIKDTELETLKEELELLKAQFAKEQTSAQEKILASEKKQEELAADAAESRAELAKSQKAATESVSAAKEVKEAKITINELTILSEGLKVDLTSLREEVQTLEQAVQFARDSEEAARYTAQVAFAARDTADEVNQQLKDQLTQLQK
ncbi:hypothetical protein PHMEG_00024796 [Phytophthora megakarya]|uniref:Calponin-homology (CH) domain-containing protein n=1 Tax=Phytophthora megakarya TaxID=4795 RepID=A0A225VF15_9STRA|nr:hypothetical protein PHMEG_00024796 [Phytophthora megakarya]